MATALPEKGGGHKFMQDKCLKWLEENGDSENAVVVKTDQEPAIKSLMQAIMKYRPEGWTIPEEAPRKRVPGESAGSNGRVERRVGEVEGKTRALFINLEDRLGREIDARERIVAFMPEHAAYLMNSCKVGEDGKVPYQRLKGKKPSVLTVEFGERLFYKVKIGNKL